MANIQVTFLPLFLLLLAVKADKLEQSTNISLGSSLFTNIHPTSWVSPSGLFAFGFYRQSNGYAIGIWLASKPEITVVWTANRNDPPLSSNTTIEFTTDGRLLLRTDQGVEKPIANLPNFADSASLFDSGNFVIYNKSRVIWESFDYPTDTIVGGQNLSSGNRLVSSASASDRSMGRFFLSMQSDRNLVAYPVNSSGRPEDTCWSTNTVREAGTVWLNLNRTGHLCLGATSQYGPNIFTLANSSNSDHGNYKMVIYRATLDPDGNFRLYSHRFKAIDNSSTVLIEWSALQNQCEVKGFCGFNSFCSSTGSVAEYCFCFPGFVFVDPNKKFLGCYQAFIDEGSCGNKIDPTLSYNITTLENMQLGGHPYSTILLNKEEYCGRSCLEDCNCWAAVYMNGTCNKHKLPLIHGILNSSKSATPRPCPCPRPRPSSR